MFTAMIVRLGWGGNRIESIQFLDVEAIGRYIATEDREEARSDDVQEDLAQLLFGTIHNEGGCEVPSVLFREICDSIEFYLQRQPMYGFDCHNELRERQSGSLQRVCACDGGEKDREVAPGNGRSMMRAINYADHRL
jgi:hypothetical protein